MLVWIMNICWLSTAYITYLFPELKAQMPLAISLTIYSYLIFCLIGFVGTFAVKTETWAKELIKIQDAKRNKISYVLDTLFTLSGSFLLASQGFLWQAITVVLLKFLISCKTTKIWNRVKELQTQKV